MYVQLMKDFMKQARREGLYNILCLQKLSGKAQENSGPETLKDNRPGRLNTNNVQCIDASNKIPFT